MPDDNQKWSRFAEDRLFKSNGMAAGNAPKMIDDRGMVEVNRGLVRAMRDEGFSHATPQYAGTGTTYLHAVHPGLPYPVTMRFSTHAHDAKEGGSDRPFGLVRKDITGRGNLHYDIDTTSGVEKFRERLDAARAHIHEMIQK